VITYADFARRTGQRFRLQHPDGSATPAILVECQAMAVESPETSFSLTFMAGPDTPIEQASFTVSGADFGPESIFLVPIEPVRDDSEFAVRYQAVFTRLPESSG